MKPNLMPGTAIRVAQLNKLPSLQLTIKLNGAAEQRIGLRIKTIPYYAVPAVNRIKLGGSARKCRSTTALKFSVEVGQYRSKFPCLKFMPN